MEMMPTNFVAAGAAAKSRAVDGDDSVVFHHEHADDSDHSNVDIDAPLVDHRTSTMPTRNSNDVADYDPYSHSVENGSRARYQMMPLPTVDHVDHVGKIFLVDVGQMVAVRWSIKTFGAWRPNGFSKCSLVSKLK